MKLLRTESYMQTQTRDIRKCLEMQIFFAVARVTSRRKHNSDIIVTAFRKHSHIVHIAMFTAARRKYSYISLIAMFTAARRKHSYISHIAMFTAARRKNRYILHIAMFTATCYTSELQRFDCIKVLVSFTYLFCVTVLSDL